MNPWKKKDIRMILRSICSDRPTYTGNAGTHCCSNSLGSRETPRSVPSSRPRNNSPFLRQISRTLPLLLLFQLPCSYKTRNSLFPAAPRIGDSTTPAIRKPMRAAAALTCSITFRCFSRSRTTPPFPTSPFPTSN